MSKQKNYENTPYTKNINPLNNRQEKYMAALKEYPVIFGVGSAGTGKTYIAVMQAIKEYEEHKIAKIVLVRPAVATEELGFLPGDLEEKLDPYLKPLFDALESRWGPRKVANMLNDTKEIEIAPLAFMRGRTFSNCVIILDEAQNITLDQMKMFLTRLGEQVKCIITGDLEQSDLPTNNGLQWAIDKLKNCSSVQIIHFNQGHVVRSELVKEILHYLER